MKKSTLFIVGIIGAIVAYFLLFRKNPLTNQPANANANTAGPLSPWYDGWNNIQPQLSGGINQTGSILSGIGSLAGGFTPLLKSVGSWFSGGNTSTPSTPVSAAANSYAGSAQLNTDFNSGSDFVDTNSFDGGDFNQFDWGNSGL